MIRSVRHPRRSLRLPLVIALLTALPIFGAVRAPVQSLEAASPIVLRVEPASASVAVGSELTVDLKVVAGDQPVDGIQTGINYPVALLEVVRVEAGSVFATPLLNRVDAANGTVEFGAGRGQTQAAPNGTFTLASIRFRGKAAGSAAVRFSGPTEAAFGGAELPVTTQDGTVNVTAGASDGGTSSPSPSPAPGGATPPASSSADIVNTASGGTVSSQGITVTVPAGATSPATSLKIQITTTSGPSEQLLPQGRYPASAAFRIALTDAAGAAVGEVAAPLRLEVPLQEQDLRLAGNDPARLQLFRHDTVARNWQPLPTTADATSRTAQASTTFSGEFALLAQLAPAADTQPADVTLPGLETELSWSNPPYTAQFHIQVVPFNQDGPAINLIIGQRDLVEAARFQVPPPVIGRGPYILLPGMTYAWQVRVSPLQFALSEHDTGWSAFVGGVFRTPPPTSSTIAPVSPAPGSTVETLMPTLQWTNSNPQVFYYEVQLSADPAFDADPQTAIAAVYWNLVHGGMTSPLNSWAVPAQFPLQAETTYFWRVRPRVQGDGVPVQWSEAFRFRTP